MKLAQFFQQSLLFLFLCFVSISGVYAADQLIIYSDVDNKALKAFTTFYGKEQQVRIHFKTDTTEALIEKLQQDGEGSQADVFVTSNMAYLEIGRQMGLFKPPAIGSVTGGVPMKFRAKDDAWTGLAASAQVLVIKDGKQATELESMFDLADPKWKGRIAVPSMSDESFVNMVTAYRELKGDEVVKAWLLGLKENAEGKYYDTSLERVRHVLSGKKDVAIAGHADLFSAVPNIDDVVDNILIPDQGKQGMGVVWNVLGVAIIKANQQSHVAENFIDLFLTARGQGYLHDLAAYYSINKEFAANPNMPEQSKYKIVDVPLEVYGQKREETITFLQAIFAD